MDKLPKKRNLCVNILNIFSSIFIISLIYYFLIPLFVASPPIHESLFEPFSSEFPWITADNPFFLFFSNVHPYCISSFFLTLTNRFIPELLHTHPMNYILNYNYHILVLCFLLQLYVIKENFVKYFQNKNFLNIFLLIIFPIVTCILFENLFFATSDDCWGYAYILIPSFAYALFSQIEYLYVTGEKISKKKICLLTVLFICVSVSNEIFKLMLCSGAFILYILHIVFINKRINHKKYWLLYIIGVIILLQSLLNPALNVWVSTKDCHYSVTQIINMLPNCFVHMFNIYVMKNILIIGTLVSLCFLLLFSPKSIQKKKLSLFLISILLSLLITLLSFILGYENYQNITYMFEHRGIVFITKIVLLNLIFSILGYLICTQKNIYNKFIIPLIIFLILFIPSVKLIKDYYNGVIPAVKYEKYMLLKRFYILERLFTDYGIKNKIYFYDYKNGDINELGIYYFKNLYDRNSDISDYKSEYICDYLDNFAQCEHKLINFTEQKTGYTFTNEELEKLDFSVYHKYIVWF